MNGAGATVVLVHGAFHGAWCWQRVTAELDGMGVASVAVELPFTAYEDDVAAVRAVLRSIPSAAVLVGHSLGGGVVCQAGDEPNVRYLGYLSAMVVDRGQSVRERLTSRGVVPELQGGASPALAAAMRFDPPGHASVDPAAARDVFFGDCTAADAAIAASQLRPISLASLSGVPTVEPWRDKPSSFVFCEDDAALPSPIQKAFADGLTCPAVSIRSSHSPFWSRPADLAAIIAGWARQIG